MGKKIALSLYKGYIESILPTEINYTTKQAILQIKNKDVIY